MVRDSSAVQRLSRRRKARPAPTGGTIQIVHIHKYMCCAISNSPLSSPALRYRRRRRPPLPASASCREPLRPTVPRRAVTGCPSWRNFLLPSLVDGVDRCHFFISFSFHKEKKKITTKKSNERRRWIPSQAADLWRDGGPSNAATVGDRTYDWGS